MSREARRRYVPAEAYRFMVLAALAHRAPRPASKGDLAWETRANHYMLTRVLAELVSTGDIVVASGPAQHRITLTDHGHEFLARHRTYFARTFGQHLAAHFRYGAPPAWVVAFLP